MLLIIFFVLMASSTLLSISIGGVYVLSQMCVSWCVVSRVAITPPLYIFPIASPHVRIFFNCTHTSNSHTHGSKEENNREDNLSNSLPRRFESQCPPRIEPPMTKPSVSENCHWALEIPASKPIAIDQSCLVQQPP